MIRAIREFLWKFGIGYSPSQEGIKFGMDFANDVARGIRQAQNYEDDDRDDDNPDPLDMLRREIQ